MEEHILEEIGLTKREVAVYFTLLELGSSSVGPITKQARVSSSKVYSILDRLIEKGLVGHVTKENVKYFEAAPPVRILDYLREKKQALEKKEQQIKTILPELELKQKLKELKSGAQIFKGNKGWQTAFGDILNTLKKGEELLVTGIFDFDEQFQNMIKRFHTKRDKLGITSRILLDTNAKSMGNVLDKLPHTKIKYFPQGMSTPGVFLIYADKTLITLPNQRTFIQIENEEAATAFRAYFEAIWNQEVTVYEGEKPVTSFFTNILSDLKKGEEYYVLNGNYGKGEFLKEFFSEYHKQRQAKGIKANLLFNNNVRPVAKKYALTPSEMKFLPPDFISPLQITFYKDKLYISLWEKKPLGFLIRGTEIVAAFKAYFETLWNQDVQTWKGDKAIELLTDEVLDEKSDLYLIGAHGYMPDRFPKTHERLIKGLKGRKRFQLAKEITRGTAFNVGENVEVRYLPAAFHSPLVIWICGDIVAHAIWEDKMTIFRIKNRKIADDYRMYFELLKKSAHP